MAARASQLVLDYRTWGGRRAGAGRKPSGAKAGVPHRRRQAHDVRHPLHVTLRAVRELPSLRDGRLFPVLRRALSAGSKRAFRIVHFSVQSNHVHLLVEADGTPALVRGLQGLGIRLAKAVNRMLGRRGSVWADRYHARALSTPREVRNGLVYVLMNWRKHRECAHGLDPCSSARWFTGWRHGSKPPEVPSPVTRARTWLLTVGWRRWGAVGLQESPLRVRRTRC